MPALVGQHERSALPLSPHLLAQLLLHRRATVATSHASALLQGQADQRSRGKLFPFSLRSPVRLHGLFGDGGFHAAPADGDSFASPPSLCQQTPMPLWEKPSVTCVTPCAGAAQTRVAVSLLFGPTRLFGGDAFCAYG